MPMRAMHLLLAALVGSILFMLPALALPQDETPVADNHVHVRSQQAANAWQQINRTNSAVANPAAEQVITGRDVLLDLRLGGMDKALLVSEAHTFSMPELNPIGEYPLVRAENDFVAEQVAIDPQRLTGLCAVDPIADYALDEVQRCAQQLGLTGVSLHFRQSDIDLRSNGHLVKLNEFFEFLTALDYPVLIHLATRNQYYGSVDVKLFIDNVLINAPSLDIQIAHLGGQRQFSLQSDRAMSEFIAAFSDGRLQPSNLQFDLAIIPPPTQNQAATQNQTRQKSLAAMYAQRMRQLDPQQLLFTSVWSEQTGVNSSTFFLKLRNDLSLSPQTISSFLGSTSRLIKLQH